MKLSRFSLVLAGAFLLVAGGTALAMHDAIEQIMEKGFKKGGLRHNLSTEVDKDAPNWSEVQKNSQEFVKLCEELCKQDPPKGEKESWKKLTEGVTKEAKKLGDLAGKKDLANAKATMAKINGSCKACHDVHRE